MQVDYRQILKGELEQRSARNPGYSLRAFAKTLKLQAPHLSAVLNGKRGLSASSAEKIANVLAWDDEEKKIFVELVKARHSRAKREKQKATSRLEELQRSRSFTPIGDDEFQLIADWHHFAILHLFELEDFEGSQTWIAKKLSLSLPTVESALERLDKLGLIDLNNWSIKRKFIATADIPSSAIRQNLHQVMRKAGDALETQPNQERDFSALFLPINPARVTEAKLWLKDFRRKFCADLDKDQNKSAVYCLATQFFQLTTKETL